MSNTSAIIPCAPCTKNGDNGPAAEFQSKKYGKGVRVHTVAPGKNPKDLIKEARCTVCSSKQFVSEHYCLQLQTIRK